nr:gas vesicle accessory protein GvpU [uncultured Pseudomonas sp.]
MEEAEEFKTIDLAKLMATKDKDWFLSMLVKIANNGPGEFGVTLNVGGSIISGMLISGRKYFDEFAKQFATPFRGENEDSESPSIEATLKQFGQIYDKTENEETDDKENNPVSYIHLRDANIFFRDGTIPTNQGVLWRGKLSSVDGFSLGNLNRQ